MIAGLTSFLNLVVWDVKTHSVQKTIKLPHRPQKINNPNIAAALLRWSPLDPHVLAVAVIETILIVDVRSGKIIDTLSTDNKDASTPPQDTKAFPNWVPQVLSFTWSPNGRYIVAGYSQAGGTMAVWDLQKKNVKKDPQGGHVQDYLFPPPGAPNAQTGSIFDLSWSPMVAIWQADLLTTPSLSGRWILMRSEREKDMVQQNALQRDEMQLGRYRLLKRVGRGGMGEVWLAEDPQLHRQVAIKMLSPQKQHKEEDSALFEREAQMVAALNHPHVLPVHDYGEQRLPDGQVINYLVMPYISGGSLADLVERHKASGEGFHYREALAYLMQAAEAIDYAHTQGMIHRDIKPANMMLRSEGSLLLADFGIALMVAHDDDSDASGAMVGTPLYIAPEQAKGKPTAASDLYSLAVIAFLFVTGRPPFEAETTYATIVQHIVNAPPSPRQWHPDLPTECEAVLLRGLAKKPEERYPTAREFVAALMRSLGAEDMLPASLQPPSSPSPATPGQDNPKQLLTRRDVLIGSAASVVVLGGVAGGVWALSRSVAPQPKARTSLGVEKPAMVLRDLQAPPDALLWMPGTHMLTTTSGAESKVKLWDIDTLRVQNLPAYRSTASQSVKYASQAAWSADGKYFAVCNSSADDLKSI